MKQLFIFILFITNFSYSQIFKSTKTIIEKNISICNQWIETGSLKLNCQNYKKCRLKLYTKTEPIMISCLCHIKHSTKHPEYSPNINFPYWNSYGRNVDVKKAEKEAKEGCTSQFDLTNKNPEHWITSIKCGVNYRYVCKDGSIEMKTYYETNQ